MGHVDARVRSGTELWRRPHMNLGRIIGLHGTQETRQIRSTRDHPLKQRSSRGRPVEPLEDPVHSHGLVERVLGHACLWIHIEAAVVQSHNHSAVVEHRAS